MCNTRADIRFLVIQDPKENRRKCTVSALADAGSVDFRRLALPRREEAPLTVPGGIWLDVDAPPLEPADRERLGGDRRVIVLDASWARLAGLARRIRAEPVARRSLPAALRTAYPRRSKLHDDPERGLASVEAIFAVTAILAEPRLDLLHHYHWKAEFLRLNRTVFDSLEQTRSASCVRPCPTT